MTFHVIYIQLKLVPEKPTNEGIKSKKSCRFLSRFLKAKIGSPPADINFSPEMKNDQW